MSAPSGAGLGGIAAGPVMQIRAVVFDAGHTLLEMDYAKTTEYLRSRGHHVDEAAVTDAERRARVRLDIEQAMQSTRERTGQGRYVRYLLDTLGIADDAERRALVEWRRGFNHPVGLCHQADREAASAVRRVRDAGLVVGVISNSNGSVQSALERAGLGPLDFVIDSSKAGMAKPDPRIFAAGLHAAGTRADETVYIGDSYYIDVVGAQRAGLHAVLFDPGGLMGDRACPAAPGLLAAVELALS